VPSFPVPSTANKVLTSDELDALLEDSAGDIALARHKAYEAGLDPQQIMAVEIQAARRQAEQQFQTSKQHAEQQFQAMTKAQQGINQHNAMNAMPNGLSGGLQIAATQLNYQFTPAVTVSPLTVVATRKIDRLIEQLPLRVLAKIARITFVHGNPMMFTVAYLDGHRAEFTDIENFPSDADVAKVLVELP
jgi:hypothetical protein